MLWCYANTWPGPIVCPHLNISPLMVNMLNDWLETGEARDAGPGPDTRLMTRPRHEPHLSPCLRVPSSVPGGVSPDRNIAKCSNTRSGNLGKTSSAFWTMSRSRRKMRRFQNTQKSRSPGGKRRERRVSHESGLCLLLFALPIIIMITHRSWWIHRSSIMWAPEGSFVWESNNLPHESIF